MLHDKVTSYVQLRGSVPIFWEQTGIQGVGGHRIQLTRGAEFTQPAFDKYVCTVCVLVLSWLLIARHMKWLIDKYGHTLLVNLLGNKEAEQVLSEAYQVTAISYYYSNIFIVTAIL